MVTGVAARNSRNEVANCGTQCGGGRAAPDSALSVTSTVLTVIAAAAVSAGVMMFLVDGKRPKKRRLSPKLGLKLSPQRGAASALWRF